MADYYFIQVYEKGLSEDKAECFIKESDVFSRVQDLVLEKKKFSLYTAECKMDLT